MEKTMATPKETMDAILRYGLSYEPQNPSRHNPALDAVASELLARYRDSKDAVVCYDPTSSSEYIVVDDEAACPVHGVVVGHMLADTDVEGMVPRRAMVERLADLGRKHPKRATKQELVARHPDVYEELLLCGVMVASDGVLDDSYYLASVQEQDEIMARRALACVRQHHGRAEAERIEREYSDYFES